MPAGVTNQSGSPVTVSYQMPGGVIGDYTHSGGLPSSPAFMATTTGNHDYVDSPVGAWSPTLREYPGGTPDPGRNKDIPLQQYRPDGDEAPRNWWLGKGPGRVKQAQHTALETVDADGWARFQALPGVKRAAPDVRRTPPSPDRATDVLSPSSYTFSREFDQRFSHRLTGQHFSMADHRRNFPILGMQPPPFRRNTYRIDPAPWDTNIVDYEPVSAPQPGRVTQVDVARSPNASWRLS